jgi:serine protease Do
MDFFNGFSQSPRRGGFAAVLLAALFGAVVGGALAAYTVLHFIGQDMARMPSEQNIREDPPPTVRDLPEHQNTAVVRAAEQVLPTIVGISNKAQVYDLFHGRSVMRERASGTGVIISREGHIVTNNHVVAGASELQVTLSTGEERSARLIGADAATDLAVIKIEQENLPDARFGDSDALAVGEVAIAIGNPLGLEFSRTVTVGVISARQRSINIDEHTFNFIQTDAAINEGNSGGALVNLRGEVIGINTAKIKIPGVEGMGFAIPSNTANKIARDLILHGRIIRPWMGVWHGGNLDEAKAAELQLPVNYGVLVQEVVRGGPADLAGLRSGDLIVGMAGQKITSFADLRRVIHEHQVGDEVEITIFRGRGQLALKVRLAELPERVN